MSESGHELRENNEKIVKLMALLKKQRDEMSFLIEKQQEEKSRIQNEIERLSFKLSLLTKSLNQRIQARSNYDRTIHEIEENYSSLVEESGKLLFCLTKEFHHLEEIMDKKTGTELSLDEKRRSTQDSTPELPKSPLGSTNGSHQGSHQESPQGSSPHGSPQTSPRTSTDLGDHTDDSHPQANDPSDNENIYDYHASQDIDLTNEPPQTLLDENRSRKLSEEHHSRRISEDPSRRYSEDRSIRSIDNQSKRLSNMPPYEKTSKNKKQTSPPPIKSLNNNFDVNTNSIDPELQSYREAYGRQHTTQSPPHSINEGHSRRTSGSRRSSKSKSEQM